jgi:hypothetical protein
VHHFSFRAFGSGKRAAEYPTVRALRTAVATLALLAAAGCEPQDRRPGLWLSGEVASEPVADWAWSDAHSEIFLETRTWYGVPHSVTVVCAADGARLYVPSLYRDGGGWPDAKYWNRNVARDPNVRLGIGDRLYERKAVLVTDEAERDRALAAFARKYPFWAELAAKPHAERLPFAIVRMDPR